MDKYLEGAAHRNMITTCSVCGRPHGSVGPRIPSGRNVRGELIAVTPSDIYCCDNCAFSLVVECGLAYAPTASERKTHPTTPIASVDTNNLPHDNGVCSNCWCSYAAHVGWRCPNFTSDKTKFSELHENGRYKTGITKVPEDAVKEDVIDWRRWRDHERPKDECPCGSRWGAAGVEAKPGECVYHRR